MSDLTLRQRKLLKLLTLDARLPKKTIAAAIGISQDAVAYQIDLLVRERKLVTPVAAFDARVLGYRYVHYFAQAMPDETALTRLGALPFVTFVMTCVGRFDLQVILAVRDERDAKRKIATVRKLLPQRTDELLLDLDEEFSWTHALPILDVPVTARPPRTHPFRERRQLAARTPGAYALDDTDCALLPHVLAEPAAPYTVLARASGLSHETVRQRFRAWYAAGFLLGITARPDYRAFGTFANFLLIKAPGDARIGSKLRELPFVFYAARMRGPFDYLVYTYDADPAEFARHAKAVRALFPRVTRFELFVFDDIHTYRQFPLEVLTRRTSARATRGF